MIDPKAITADFRRLLLISGATAGVAIVPGLIAVLASHFDKMVAISFGMTALALSLLCGLPCMIIFVAALFAHRLRGLWFALPVIATWGLPAGLFVYLETLGPLHL